MNMWLSSKKLFLIVSQNFSNLVKNKSLVKTKLLILNSKVFQVFKDLFFLNLIMFPFEKAAKLVFTLSTSGKITKHIINIENIRNNSNKMNNSAFLFL